MKNKLGLLAILFCAGAAVSGPYDAWSNYRSVTVNATTAAITSTLSNFPLLVRLTNADSAHGSNVLAASATGADVRFTDSTGATALSYQIERWTNTAAEIWVLVPSIPSGGSTNIRMYWGKSGSVDASSGPSVFNPGNGFVAVYHFAETGLGSGGTSADATGLGHTATVALAGAGSAPGDATDGIGVGKTFNGNNSSLIGSYFLLAQPDSANYGGLNLNTQNGPWTISAWVKPTACTFTTNSATSGRYAVISKYSGATGGPKSWFLGGNNAATSWKMNFMPSNLSPTTGNNEMSSPTPAVCVANQWQYLSVSYADATNPAIGVNIPAANFNMSFNGVSDGTPTTGNNTTGSNTASVRIGAADDGSRLMNGSIDEVVVSNVQRTPDWTKLCYATQIPGAAVVTLGTTQATASVPGAPTGAAGNPGNGQVTVSWTAPSSNGGAAITSYTATAVQDTSKHCSTATTSCIVTGLTNGTGYTFTVTATNSAGTGSASAPSASVTPVGVAGAPGAPTNVQGAAGNAQVVVSWTAPASTGSSAITGYVAASSPGGYVCPSTTSLSCTVAGLTNGTAYTFTVTATNAQGPGPASAPSAQVTPVSAPSAPRGVTGIGGAGQVAVSWVAPAATGGAPITKYTVTSSPGNDTCTTNGTLLTCTVTGLASGTGYTFTVTATNAVGTSGPSAASGTVTTGILAFSAQYGFGVHMVGSSVVLRFPAGIPEAQVSVMDIWGRTIWSHTVDAGVGELVWDGKSAQGRSAARGMYLVRLTSADRRSAPLAESKVMLLH